MEIDIRKHPQAREDVRAALAVLRVQGRQIWGSEKKYSSPEVVIRLMVGVGDLARLARDWHGKDKIAGALDADRWDDAYCELKKELGNIIFSTVRWIDDLGLDVLECLDLAIEAQEKFANSGRPR